VPPLMPKESALFKVQQGAWGERSRQPVFFSSTVFRAPNPGEDASLPGSIPRDTHDIETASAHAWETITKKKNRRKILQSTNCVPPPDDITSPATNECGGLSAAASA
jgi:hypothetical protein